MTKNLKNIFLPWHLGIRSQMFSKIRKRNSLLQPNSMVVVYLARQKHSDTVLLARLQLIYQIFAPNLRLKAISSVILVPKNAASLVSRKPARLRSGARGSFYKNRMPESR